MPVGMLMIFAKKEIINLTKERLKKAGLIFLYFAKIGCFTFGGGWSILAQMEREFIDKRKWITKSDLLDLTAAGKSLPGIMITNISMLFGVQIAGAVGGIAAVLGITVPSVAIITVVTKFYELFKDNFWVSCVLRGVRAAVVPIVASSAVTLAREAFREKTGVFICAAAFLLIVFAGVSNITLVLMGAAAAFIWMWVEKKHGTS